MKNLLTSFLLAFCFSAVAADKNIPDVVLDDFQLSGDLTNGIAAFTMRATAIVQKGDCSLPVLSGSVALTQFRPDPKWQLEERDGGFALHFTRAGKYPVELKFQASVHSTDGWNEVEFRVASATLQPIRLKGISPETQLEFTGAARPERHESEFTSFLAGDGLVKFRWKESRQEGEGKLFYAAEMLSQVSVSPGLLRQTALFDFKVMQGELKNLSLILRGAGEVTRVQGEQVLAWRIEPVVGSNERRLLVQFNQVQKDQFALQIHTQSPLGTFPQTVDVLQLQPESATRFSGYYRIVNDGAVRLELSRASGLSQVSPDQFPETDLTRALLRPTGTQRFVYRFSGSDFALRIQADQILPELFVSELINYHLGENDLAIEGEFEVDIREAPLRELILRVPHGYSIARLNAAGLSDYFLLEPENTTSAELRLVFGQPMTGRQVMQLRLERNKQATEATWALPRIDVARAKSVRGHIATAADPGFRLTPERTAGLTEIATAFFPGKLTGIQSAFRLGDADWQASLRIERLPQTVQADVLHLFSIGEGIAYGSSVINYAISGAPVAIFRIELSDEYFNVEFTGKDIRNWQKVAGGYQVQLHTPVSGAYTLLATYERPFRPQGETLTFAGARPLDAQSEQGHTLVISAYQFQVRPVDVSPGLFPVEPGEVPAEYRLFFDAPILAAYRYATRPFNLKLALSPLAQGDSLSLVVDRASLSTKISKEGQVLTDVRYFIKNRGNPHFRITLPPGTRLWSASVNRNPVVPVTEANSNLIPLPSGIGPNSVVTLDLKLASTSTNPTRIRVSAPIVQAPVMLAEWKFMPDTGQRLAYRGGSLTPAAGEFDSSGFAQLARTFARPNLERALAALLPVLAFMVLALIAWHWAGGAEHRLNARHVAGLLVGAAALFVAAALLTSFADQLRQYRAEPTPELAFLAPVQQAGSPLNLDVLNLEDKVSILGTLAAAWPAALAIPVWFIAWMLANAQTKNVAVALGWVFLAWAALRVANGGVLFLILCGVFVMLHAALPIWVRSWRRPEKASLLPAKPGTSAATASIILLATLALASSSISTFARTLPSSAQKPIVPELVSQNIRVEDKFAVAAATIRWQAEKGQVLTLLFPPAVLTHLHYPEEALRLGQALASVPCGDAGITNPVQVQQLTAKKNGLYDLEINYELPIIERGGDSGFYLPTSAGLINRLNLNLSNLDVDVASPQAVSVQPETEGTNTIAHLILSPSERTWVGWKPRSRDVTHEKPVFYADLSQLYVPMAGVVEGEHLVSIRLAQGELKDLVFTVPARVTITDVVEIPRDPKLAGAQASSRSIVALWRFDPDARRLRVTLSPPQARPFTLLIKSQMATGPLPFEQSLGLLSVLNAAEQLGLAGLATGNEVQLDGVTPESLSPINLEDFPADLVTSFQSQIAGATLRRAFRYSNQTAQLSFKASPVEPDIRVESQDTVSLGEDRTVLAANATVGISRAGIFRLSFVLPPGFDVESISGSALSHWTETHSETNRVVTLHLNGKTEGQQQFAIGLAGPGVRATNGWVAPQLILREAGKHTGTVLLVPEQGLRLQVVSLEGLTQLDPQKAGIKQKGVLAFRAMQPARSLVLNLERVDPWIQVTSLQHVSIAEAQAKISANLQYQIENTGLKNFHVLVPANAEGVLFQGEQVADFLPLPASITNGLQVWEVRLHRRLIGPFGLHLSYQIPVAQNANTLSVRGVQAAEVNMQRGFVTIQSSGRLQVRVDSPPAALQPAEWQSIPRPLQQGLPGNAANFCYRLVETDFNLPLVLERYQAAQLLPARVSSATLKSVISDEGVMLTQVTLEIYPGEKRLLRMTLPPDAHFWFAFVNQAGVWPWREQDQILIPLEQQSVDNQRIPVEVFYTCKIGDATRRSLNLALPAPKFDLPLENITWRLALSDKWELKKWSGTLQLQSQEMVPQAAALDLESYLQSETVQQRQRTRQAEDFLAAANSALAQGDPQQARRAFQSAYGLSTHDAAFNEDARVQLHNIKLQEALVGLNVRQAVSTGDAGALGGKLRELRDRKTAGYTQQDAKDIIERNSSDENAAFMRLAERMIQQQDAAVTAPAAIHATIPEQGRILTFKRAVLVDPWSALNIEVKAVAAASAASPSRIGLLAAALLAFFSVIWMSRSRSSYTAA